MSSHGYGFFPSVDALRVGKEILPELEFAKYTWTMILVDCRI